ncbi:Serine acetyltransferase [Galdieria sulphuraria]|uniref:serine O-acetyltransferase n=1 Tax=Galdieria sulphuraria TaxID=130081 RepID=M2XVW9_GALSU|nr:serine O-acetyltransferase [Galdieria sulphuraria]EME27579.1 serine O-acetyltransferase [Galdieria sulphuraria]GJD09774.1 Serine acetyltransferase [Galdieria sulphuraria]|eukprot:XP_005704099.1 serine O-acetyltransferase [Galdieria sulphuraria]
MTCNGKTNYAEEQTQVEKDSQNSETKTRTKETEAKDVANLSSVDMLDRLREAVENCCDESEDERDWVWLILREEAQQHAYNEPLLASFLFSTILNHKSLEAALSFHLANKLASPTISSTLLMELFRDALEESKDFRLACRRDLIAVKERDPACTFLLEAFLYFKGYHALQAYRVSHWLWSHERKAMAYFLHSQITKELHIDIHPGAKIGHGVFVDHGTGIVIGETAIVEDDVSMLHHVTLGGSGKKYGDRHPIIHNGVLLGAGATILGRIEIGEHSQIGACSLVLNDVPSFATVVGVPARIIGRKPGRNPASEMQQDFRSSET